MNIPSAEYFEVFLDKIYHCKKPFEVKVRDRMPKTRMGSYSPSFYRINISSQWIVACPLEEIAIHEYAHHIHWTEHEGHRRNGDDRMHGKNFWRIYSALMSRATRLGLYHDYLIEDIVEEYRIPYGNL